MDGVAGRAPGSGGTAGSTSDGSKAGADGASAGSAGADSGASGGGGTGIGNSGGAAGGGSAGTAGPGGLAGKGGVSGTGGTAGSGGAPPSSSSGLPVPPGPGNVPRPTGTPGNITVINWAGFKGAVSYTFDDSKTSQTEHYPELQALGVPYTFYMETRVENASNPLWATVVKDGHEIGNHTKSHLPGGTVEDIDAATEFIKSKWGVTPMTLAAPNGSATYTALAKGRFFINRGTYEKLVLPNDNTDPLFVPCYFAPMGSAASVFNAQVDSARTGGGWRIILVHGFVGGNDGAYLPIPISSFVDAVKYTKSLGDMWIGRMDTVGAYWVGQKAFSQATTTTAGNEKTWKWKLPDRFPPGKFLRVTVAGGTLKQNGTELAWDEHGYYEIALDAGAVTVSP